MDPVKWYIYNEKDIPDQLIENNVYYCTNTEKIFFDYDGRRNTIHPVPKYLINDIDRFSVIVPENNRMYITINSGLLWLYINGWILLSSGSSTFFEYPKIIFKRSDSTSKVYIAKLADLMNPSFFGIKIKNFIDSYSQDQSDNGVNEFFKDHALIDMNDIIGNEILNTSVTMSNNIINATVTTTNLLTTDELYGRVLFCSDKINTTVIGDIAKE